MLLEIVGRRIRISSSDAAVLNLVRANFGFTEIRDRGGGASLSHRIERADSHVDQLLGLLEHEIVVALQRLRPDLLFLHAAVLEWRGGAYLFAAESGVGKSTLAWALLNRGFAYLSDELAPIEPQGLRVWPYAHALCLKQAPPAPYRLPGAAITLGGRIHVPCASLPAPVARLPLPLRAAFLLERSPNGKPSLHALDAATAAARLYVTALNALAHSGCGLDPALRIAQHVPCYALAAGELSATCDLILGELSRSSPDTSAQPR